MVFQVLPMHVEGTQISTLYMRHRELYLAIVLSLYFRLTKILDAKTTLSVQKFTQTMLILEHEGELLEKQNAGIIAQRMKVQIIYTTTMPSQKKNSASKSRIRTGALLTKVPVKAGDFFYVPSGTMHAIGAGILILETPSSLAIPLTVYDFDRKDDKGNLRELHLEKNLSIS